MLDVFIGVLHQGFAEMSMADACPFLYVSWQIDEDNAGKIDGNSASSYTKRHSRHFGFDAKSLALSHLDRSSLAEEYI